MSENNYKKAGTFYLVGNVFNKGIAFLTVPVSKSAGRRRDGCALLMKMTTAAVARPSTAPMAR